MSLQLIIGNKNYSSWSLRPWVFMQQNKIAFTEERVALYEQDTNKILSRYRSDFKVPILIDDEIEVWDSLSILEYLSEQYMDGSGYPEDIEARALARSVSNEIHSSFMNVKNELPMNCSKKFSHISLSLEAKEEVKRITDIWQMCKSKRQTQGEWLFGDYSIADAMFAPIALRFSGYNIKLDDNAQAYVQSVLKQPCVAEWMAQGRAEKEVIQEDEITITGNVTVETWKS